MSRLLSTSPFIRLYDGLHTFRFYLDADALDEGKVVAPDGTGEQCSGCGSVLGETASVVANAHRTKVVCDHCGETYKVEGL